MPPYTEEHLAEETPPRPKAMINTFRAFGYNLQTAIADIIDNSISAKAGNVWIEYKWAGKESWVSITDDGEGMDYHELVQAMTPGSKDPQDERQENDLGRFGLGLKTASFSQCKSLTVITQQPGKSAIKRCWDLDFVNEKGKWFLLDYLSSERFLNRLKSQGNGTTVLWEKVDRLVGHALETNEAARIVFLEEFELVEAHLSLVFHRYLEKKKLKIWLNGNQLIPWDPFLKEEEGGQLLAKEALDNGKVQIKCYLLPHISKLSPEKRLKAKTELWYKLQGFYIYRKERLLLYGDWLGLFPKNEHVKNARILIDIPNNLDHEWKIDIKKATATPSLIVRKDLIRLAKTTRKAAGKIHRFRGNQIILDDSTKSFDFQPVWKATKTRDNARHYYINQEHPVFKVLFEQEHIRRADLKKAFRLIGETTPVESIIQYHSEEPESHELRGKEPEPEAYTIELAKMTYKALRSQQLDQQLAVKQVLKIEPFNLYPQLVEHLKG